LTADVVTTDCTVVEQSCNAFAVKVSMSELNMSAAAAKIPLTIQTFF